MQKTEIKFWEAKLKQNKMKCERFFLLCESGNSDEVIPITKTRNTPIPILVQKHSEYKL